MAEAIRKTLRKIFGVIFLLLGVIFLLTPFTPGSGLFIFFGLELIGLHFVFLDKIIAWWRRQYYAVSKKRLKIRAIIFDWDQTLFDPQKKELFPGTEEVITRLAERYKLALVSLASTESSAERSAEIASSAIAKHFSVILVDDHDKDSMYEKTLRDLGALPEEVMMVDDRAVRGVAWGNKKGAITVRVKQGSFASEQSTEETGEPTYTVNNISELVKLDIFGF